MKFEKHIYGSSRLGMDARAVDMFAAATATDNGYFEEKRGEKRYELSNHLGNVLVVLSDQKLATLTNTNTLDYYTAEVLSYNDYYPFGAPMHERSGTNGGGEYRYGFNGMESIDEMVGAENGYDFGARMYDGRLGRWLSLDPRFKDDPEFSPYCFGYNSPILFYDPDGKKPKVTILPQSFAYNVGNPITTIHQLGKTSWSPTKFSRDKSGRIIGVEINIASVLNYAFVEGPYSKNNPNSKLNKENPGLYLAVSTHEGIHAAHIKALLEDDSQIYTFGDYNGNINKVYASFYNDLESQKKSAYQIIANKTFNNEKERKLAYEKVDKDIQEQAIDFENSIQNQVKKKLDEKFKEVGGEEQATIQETIRVLNASGENEAVKYQKGKSAKVNGAEIK